MLTKREEQIVELTAWGASAKEVAEFLHVSTVTIQNHLHNVKEKLHLQKATEIGAYFFCLKFNISMDLNPMKRQIGSMAMILLIAFELFNYNGSDFRARRVKIGRKSKTEQYAEL
ncbi:MAG: helix-turn-helix transcriptional regulator [Bacteroidota bacterium]